MKVAVISANLGSFDPPHEWVDQVVGADVELEVFRFTDENFPPRSKSMTPRLQARLVKCFGWQLVPGFDRYLWIDASCALLNPNGVAELLADVGDRDLLLFRHPERKTIFEEYDYLKTRTPVSRYLSSRYEGEYLEEQYDAVSPIGYFDDTLYASTVFMYKNTPRVQALLKEWWYHITRYHTIDQLALPYVVERSGCSVRVLEDNYQRCRYVSFIRPSRRRSVTCVGEE